MDAELVQIVPSLPPRIDGIRDYAGRLAERLAALGMRSVLAAPAAAATTAERATGFVAQQPIPQRDGRALERTLAELNIEIVLLHASGYGYADRGAPFWLVEGLRGWKSGRPRRRLVVMFHELWASGPVWRSSFWMSGAQKVVVRRLVDLADAFLTNTALHASRLRHLAAGRAPVAVLPVISNLGEPARHQAFQQRAPWAVTFGQGGHRQRVYDRLDRFLPLLRELDIERIVDIGPPIRPDLAARVPIDISCRGFLPSGEASDLLAQSRVGLLCYPLDYAAKSGIFAAYAAHGVLPVIDGPPGGTEDGLRHAGNLIHLPTGLPDPAAAPRCAAAAWAWYRAHDLEQAARAFHRALLAAAA